MKIIKNSCIPKLASVFIDVYAITLYPYVFIRDEGNVTTICHEAIHIKQQRELWVIGFYFLYVMYWIIGLIKHKNAREAYMSIPFEREAYDKENDAIYVLNRKRHSWMSYRGAGGAP